MIKNVLLILLASLYAVSANANDTSKTSNEKIYILNKNAKCRYRTKDFTSYCTDNENKEITGEVRKYIEGNIIHSFHVKNSLIEGKMTTKYINGNKKSEKEYIAGKIEGLAHTYYPNEKIQSIIPYKNGQINGNVKKYYENGYIQNQTIFKNNVSTGITRLYAQTGEILYDLQTSNNQIINGNCYFLDENNKLTYTIIPDILIESFNKKCLEPNTIIKENICSVKKLDDIEDCDKKWLKTNIEQIKPYL